MPKMLASSARVGLLHVLHLVSSTRGVVCKRSYRNLKYTNRACRGVCEETEHHLLHGILGGALKTYWERSPTAQAAVGALKTELPGALVCFDHFAFRTFGVEGLGVDSLAHVFLDLGYRKMGELEFPGKHLRAEWFAPPSSAFPRCFISECRVPELSPEAQAVIERYSGQDASLLGRYGLMSSLVGIQPWATPTLADYEVLAKESEYAAWVLCNGYALNHTTVSVHSLCVPGGIRAVNDLLQSTGFRLNEAGGAVKVSQDGLLLQSSTVADSVDFCFAGGEQRAVPGSYIEFAERLVLPEFQHLKAEAVREWHRRDGFEADSADKIFESTTLAVQRGS